MTNELGDFNRELFRRRSNYCGKKDAGHFNFKNIFILILGVALTIYFKEGLLDFAKGVICWIS